MNSIIVNITYKDQGNTVSICHLKFLRFGLNEDQTKSLSFNFSGTNRGSLARVFLLTWNGESFDGLWMLKLMNMYNTKVFVLNRM